MENLTNFDKLIINLSSNEKKQLLEKMEMGFELSQESLMENGEVIEDDFQTFQQEYESLSIFVKIYLFFQSLLRQKDIPAILKEYKVNQLRKKHFGNCHLADFKNGLLIQEFYNELVKLKEPCSFFRKPLQKIFMFDNKPDFYAFIGGVVLPDLQQELLIKTDPWELEKKDKELDAGIIKNEIDSNLDLTMDSISNLDRSIMNEACQSLYGLYLLSSFELNTVLGHFNSILPESGNVCRVSEVHDQLLELSGILKSLNKPPSIRALEALFLYSLDSEELKSTLNNKMSVADMYLSAIRDFNKSVPLENLIKVLTADFSKSSNKLPLVEDWFRIYRKFWNTRVNLRYAYFVNERKKNSSEKEICSLFGVRYIRPIENYIRNLYFEGSSAKYEKSLSFVQVFILDIFTEKLNPVLQTINLEGEFYKKDNKVEFDKAFHYLGLLDNRLVTILNIFKGNGFLGKKLIKATADDEEIRHNTILNAIEQIDIEISSFLDGFILHLRILNNVLYGIVLGNGGAYDTLSNISSIGGKSNSELREAFKVTSMILNKVYKYITEMKIMEEKKV